MTAHTALGFRAYVVGLMTDDGRIRVLFHSDSYDQADLKLDHYADMFPNAMVDIYSRADLLSCELAD